MIRRHRVPLSLGLTAALLTGLALAGPALAAGTRLTASMTGAEEVPGPGDADGSGTAVIRLNKGKGEAVVDVRVDDGELRAGHRGAHPRGTPGNRRPCRGPVGRAYVRIGQRLRHRR